MTYYRLQCRELYALFKSARRSALRGREICGILVRQESHLICVPVLNSEKGMGGFRMSPNHTTLAIRARGLDSGRIVGTYHSHPWSPAEPGESDLTGAKNGSLMLILACWEDDVKLWRIQDGEARRLCLLASQCDI